LDTPGTTKYLRSMRFEELIAPMSTEEFVGRAEANAYCPFHGIQALQLAFRRS
jgi:hypothetical protein